MELNDNSSTKKSFIITTAVNESNKVINAIKSPKISKESVVCTFCSKKADENFANLTDKPELLVTLKQLDIEISTINDYSDYICYQCVFKIHCIQDYKRIWSSNINKSRINFYYRQGNKEMVRRLITLKPSTSATETYHQSRARSSGSSFNGNATKEDSIISHSTDNNSNIGHDDCLQNSTQQTISKETKTSTENNLSHIKISSVNSLHMSNSCDKGNQETVQQQRTASLSEKTSIINSTKKNNMPRRSSILIENTTDLNNINSSMQKGLLEESIHVIDTLSNSATGNKKKETQLMNLHTPTSQFGRMLNIMYEENEPAAVTESGGEISSRVSTPYKDSVLKCKYCERNYKRISFLIKHERKHERDNQKTISISSKATSKMLTVYDCPECNETYSTKYKLNQHKKTHIMKGFVCPYCSKKFTLKWDADFHEAVCLGEFQAKQSTTINSACNGTARSNRYMTRSAKSNRTTNRETENFNNKYQSKRNIKQVDQTEIFDAISDTTEIDSLFSSRMRNTNRWTEHVVQMQHENEGGREEIENGINNFSFNDTGQSTTFNESNVIHNNWRLFVPGGYNTENSTESVEIQTRKSKRGNKSTNNSIKKSQPDYDLQCDNSTESYNDDAVFFYIKCQNSGCEYQNVKLENVMKHDKKTHGTRPLYYCKKCSRSFLRSYYFQIHCSNQDPGCFLCYKCRAEFMYEELLQMHLEEHHFKELQTEEHTCIICKLKFLDEKSLIKHFASNDHLLLKATPKISFLARNSYPILHKRLPNSNNNNDNNNHIHNNNINVNININNNINNDISNNNNNNNIINMSTNHDILYDETLLAEGQLINIQNNLENNSCNEHNTAITVQKYVSETRLLKLKKYERKIFKHDCECIKRNCHNCLRHKKIINPSFGKEPRPTKYYSHRSCNEVRLPFLKTRYFSYI